MATNTVDLDTFAGFVEQIARNLGDGAVSSDGLAAQAFLSRSHFDRVIKATAGEPPQTFQRRVLLERAAYRLATTDLGILEIALESGYSSHEAFVRAFRRAYDVNPSEWRASPRQIKLPTPNDVHFHPPGGLRLPTRTEVTSMDLIIKMVEHHVWLVGDLIDRAAKVDAAELDRPIDVPNAGIDDDPTIRQLLSRLVGQMDMWNRVIHDQDYDWKVEEHEDLRDMGRRLDQQGNEFLDEVRTVVAQGRLDDTFIDAHCTPPEVYTYGGLIAHVLTFAAFRRTLVIGALERAGVQGMAYGDPRKWVAEAT
jgi:AraC family transcriptional regulator